MNINVNAAEFAKALESFVGTLADPKVLGSVALEARNIIWERTQQGLDPNGDSFKPYSTRPLYIPMKPGPEGMTPRGGIKTPQARVKVRGYNSGHATNAQSSRVNAGRRGGKSMYFPLGYRQFKHGVDSSGKVSLSLTGHMFHSMRTRVSGRVGLIEFDPGLYSQKAIGNERRRHFFDVGHRAVEAARLRVTWEKAVGHGQ